MGKDMFVRNTWYVAAWDAEVTDKPLARTILGKEVVLYRTSGGQVVALEDRCPHRHLPLSQGFLEGDTSAVQAFAQTGLRLFSEHRYRTTRSLVENHEAEGV